MPSNVIDTLQLDIIVTTKQNGQSVTTLKNSLEKLYKTLDTYKNQDLSKTISDLSSLTTSLTKLAPALVSLGEGNKNLTSLGTRLKTLHKRMGEIDANVMARKFDQMTQAITPFINKLMSAQEALVALNNVMGGAKTLTATANLKATTITPQTTTNTNILGGTRRSRSSQGFGSFFSKIYRMYFAFTMAKRVGQALGNIVQKGIDFEETLNLWQTAMRGNISEARKFVAEMNKAYGVSTATLMNYQGVFKNMLAALGNISEDSAYKLSEALTQMALDFASLYNTTVQTAMTKLQSVLAGQVRPVRTAGYDITENTIYQLYQSLGGTKTVRQLTQTEKQLLRILAVFKQMGKSGATGDLRKTISSSANQLRIMKEQGAEFATWIGIAFNTLLDSSGILVKINSYILVAKELAKSFAYDMGYVEKDYQISLETEDIENANAEVDELKGKLLGFDKFQVLSSGGISQELSVEQTILDAIQKYETILGKAENPAWVGDLTKGIKGAQKILVDLGYDLVDIKNEQGEVVDQVWRQNEGQKSVLDTVKETAKSLGGLLTLVALLTKPWLVLVAAIERTYLTSEKFRSSFSLLLSSLGAASAPILQALSEIVVALSPIIAFAAQLLSHIVVLLDKTGLLIPIIFGVVVSLLLWKATNIKLFAPMIAKLQQLASYLTITKVAAAAMATAGFMVAYNAAKKLFTSWDDMSGLERAIEIFKLLAGAALVAATAIGVFHTSWSVGVVAGAITLGIASLMGYMSSIKSQTERLGNIETRAKGGLATKGSLFWAGEAGPELVTRTSGGNSTIMNMAQLEDAVAKGMFRALAGTQANESEQVVNVGIDGQNLFTIFRGVARRNGYDLVKVN